MLTKARTMLTRDTADYLIAMASRAPSVHNTQPWRFRFVDNSIELRVDPARRLHVADPLGRELVISCGAALFNLQLAIKKLGLVPRAHLLPERDGDPGLLARVQGLPSTEPSHEELQMLAAITRRHTHREPFTEGGPDPALVADLRVLARLEGAQLAVLTDNKTADRVLDLAWAADAEQCADIAWSGEMARWANDPAEPRRDGVPPEAYPSTMPERSTGQLPGRDFALGRHWGTTKTSGTGGKSVLVVLTTDGDGPKDWLRAGMALQRCLLRAAMDSVFARFATQPLELPEIRAAVRDAVRTPGFPQMVFQLGYASSGGLTPRRPVHDVLDTSSESAAVNQSAD
ncbi:MAG: hypothetical protein QOG53_2593 [Frankiales bacterium]|jgi:nitroreductase|nr:hypothetical protein [Frankiales bacterium]